MFKKILLALLVLVVAAGVGLYIFSGKLDGLIKEAIETEGTAALGSAVRVAKVVTDFKQGRAEISGFKIANPAGYQAANAIELSDFAAEVNYSDQTVEEIIINNPVINAEQKGTRSNFQDLLDNMPDTEDEAEEESTDPGPEITIKKLALTKATINLLTSGIEIAGKSVSLGNHTFVMDDFVMTNVTGTAEQISEEVTDKLVSHVTSQVKTYMTAQLGKIAKTMAIAKAKEEATKIIQEKVGDKINEKLNTGILKDKAKLKFKLKGFGG